MGSRWPEEYDAGGVPLPPGYVPAGPAYYAGPPDPYAPGLEQAAFMGVAAAAGAAAAHAAHQYGGVPPPPPFGGAPPPPPPWGMPHAQFHGGCVAARASSFFSRCTQTLV